MYITTSYVNLAPRLVYLKGRYREIITHKSLARESATRITWFMTRFWPRTREDQDQGLRLRAHSCLGIWELLSIEFYILSYYHGITHIAFALLESSSDNVFQFSTESWRTYVKYCDICIYTFKITKDAIPQNSFHISIDNDTVMVINTSTVYGIIIARKLTIIRKTDYFIENWKCTKNPMNTPIDPQVTCSCEAITIEADYFSLNGIA